MHTQTIEVTQIYNQCYTSMPFLLQNALVSQNVGAQNVRAQIVEAQSVKRLLWGGKCESAKYGAQIMDAKCEGAKYGAQSTGRKVWGVECGGAKYGGTKWVNPYVCT